MDIKAVKSMDYTIIYAVDKKLMEQSDSALLSGEDMKSIEKQGFKITEYQEGNYEGYKLTKNISNIDKYSTEKDEEFSLTGITDDGEEKQYIFKVKKRFFKKYLHSRF